ncbi:hypothetical protein B9N43_15740 [Denitratisoma sp. DHT3]|uniref:ATP-binding response regulator n=1 Tax=Denitratisoma sp. DHT3 TaxID=1981880 RepID=UPI0011986261|nr:ATP-binding protein [Denitratisoma sp. DHT3]QDX82558.1 hypothetical protein B9N43_15740 [Denitratisoma sp. DHT3]
MRPFGIREQVLFVALAPVAATALTLILYFTSLRYDDVETSLIKRGTTMARQLAPAAEYGMFSGNIVELKRLTLAIAREADVSAIAFFDRQGRVLASTGSLRSTWPSNRLPDNWMARSSDDRTLFFHVKVIQTSKTIFNDPFLQSESAIQSGEQLFLGSLMLELSREPLLARKREILLVTLLSAGIILAGAALLAVRLGRDITMPVQALEDAVARIGKGEMSVRIAPHQAKILRALEEGVNAMAMDLDAARVNSDRALATSQAELSQQHEFADALLQAQADAGVCMLLMENYRLVYINDAALAHSGYSREESLALTDLRPFLQSHGEILQGDGLAKPFSDTESTHRFIARFRCKNGERRFFDVATTRLSKADPLRVVVIALDITQRKQDERQLASVNIELRKQKEEAERANLAKSRFLAAASHDLRQPLHALALFVAEIKERSNSEEQLRLARQINAATISLMELLDALLDISRLDLAETKAHRQALPLQPLLEAATEPHRCGAKGKGLKFSIRPTKLWGESDPQFLVRIISNLTANAVRYTQTGGILLGVRGQGKQLRIEVWDSGVGIAPEHQPYLFDEFFQVANPERDASKGLGLGLSIVARLADALEHPITVRSWPGRGSCFAVTVPRATPPAQRPVSTSLIHPPQLTARILLLAPNNETVEELTDLLRNWGCQVTQSAGDDDMPDARFLDADAILCTSTHLKYLPSSPETRRPPLILLANETGDITSPPLAGKLHYPPRPAQLRALLQHVLG